MTLETIMTRHVVSVSMDDELWAIRDLFNKFRFHHVLVMDKCRVVGVISDRDVLANLSPFVGKAAERTLDSATTHKHAHQVMTRNVISAAPDTPIGDAAMILLNNQVTCLPVLDAHGACVGIVTWRDFLRWSLKDFADKSCQLKLAKEGGQDSVAAA